MNWFFNENIKFTENGEKMFCLDAVRLDNEPRCLFHVQTARRRNPTAGENFGRKNKVRNPDFLFASKQSLVLHNSLNSKFIVKTALIPASKM